MNTEQLTKINASNEEINPWRKDLAKVALRNVLAAGTLTPMLRLKPDLITKNLDTYYTPTFFEVTWAEKCTCPSTPRVGLPSTSEDFSGCTHRRFVCGWVPGPYLPQCSAPGMGHNQAIGVIAHRLCRLIWILPHRKLRYEERVGPRAVNAAARTKGSIVEIAYRRRTA